MGALQFHRSVGIRAIHFSLHLTLAVNRQIPIYARESNTAKNRTVSHVIQYFPIQVAFEL